MAPLDFSDNVAIYSLIGTWLGTLFTLAGLLAVVTQLRSILKDFAQDRKERVKNAAGDYAKCLLNLRYSESGVLEGRAPSLSAWISKAYGEDMEVTVCPYERQISGGQSSWSRLFAQLQIKPSDLQGAVERPAKVKSLDSDVLVDGAKISYGMTGDEFAALLILCGFSPSDFKLNETSDTTGHLGHMFLGIRDPFSQIAQHDSARSSLRLRDAQDTDTAGRFTHQVNIRHCIDLAVGILRFDWNGESKILVAGKSSGFTSLSDSERLVAVRRNLTHLTRGYKQDQLRDISSAAAFDFKKIFIESNNWQCDYPSGLSRGPWTNALKAAIERAVALKALRPWGILPVLPRSLVDALVPILDDYIRRHCLLSAPRPKLSQKFRDCPKEAFNIPGWTQSSLYHGLESLNDIYLHGFSGLSAKCAMYFDTMTFLFTYHKIDFRDVEISLAAMCASNFLEKEALAMALKSPIDPLEVSSSWYHSVQAAVRERLNGSPLDPVEPWACEILAMYLHAWLKGSKHIEEDFRNNFRRRVFLG